MSNFYTEVIQKSDRFHSIYRVADLGLLEPVTRAAVMEIRADAAAAGTPLIVFETYRSQERQQALFNQGATQLRTVGTHHYGVACDLVKFINGSPSWKGSYDFLGVLAKKHGLVWGGDWGEPDVHHSFIDADHVQRCTLVQQEALLAGTWYPGAITLPAADTLSERRYHAALAAYTAIDFDTVDDDGAIIRIVMNAADAVS